MTQAQIVDPVLPPPEKPRPKRVRRKKTSSLFAQGEPLVWLTAGCLVICLLMIVGLLTLVVIQGVGTFWPQPLVRIDRHDGSPLLGEVTRTERYPVDESVVSGIADSDARAAAADRIADHDGYDRRRLMRTGNYDLTGVHFNWVADIDIAGESLPDWAVILERTSWGRFYGILDSFTTISRRPANPTERAIADLKTLLQSTPQPAGDSADEGRERFLEALDDKIQAERTRATAEFLAGFESDGSREIVVELQDGRTIRPDQVDPTANVAAVREIWTSPQEAWQRYEQYHDTTVDRRKQAERLKRVEIGDINHHSEGLRLQVRQAEIRYGVRLLDAAEAINRLSLERSEHLRLHERHMATLATARSALSDVPEAGRRLQNLEGALKARLQASVDDLDARIAGLFAEHRGSLPPEAAGPAIDTVRNYVDGIAEVRAETALIHQRISSLEEASGRYLLTMDTAGGPRTSVSLADIVRAYPANRLGLTDKLGIYLSRWWEFLSDNPREANSEGGVFPAIFGTVLMTLLMSLAVVPFGVLAALYLREYAKAGPIISAVRIAINNLAGVPSIVFGVFGLGFFCYGIGSFIDGGPQKADIAPMSPTGWKTLLAMVLLVALIAVVLGVLAARTTAAKAGRRSRLNWILGLLWVFAVGGVALLVVRSPYFDGFYQANLPNPTFGKGALIWASATLALLTLPVVIVATEEALAAVPNSMREGSYASGASKWQTIKRIVLPRAMPGIMTGMILAMARGAGEVAPLMLVGAVKLAPELPIAASPPFGVNRSFMHLGFHIYDLGFQSQNSEAAKPMVYTTTLLLITIITLLNLAAIWLRSRLRRKFVTSQF